jgi:hypothetical protein
MLAMWVLTDGCATKPPIHVMRDPQANFESFKTFAWDTGQGQDSGQAANEPLTIINSQIRGAITAELRQKGYAETTGGAKPDLVLRYETAAAEKLKSNPFRIGIGVGGYGGNGAAGVGVSSSDVKNIKEGTLVLRVIDPARNAEVWNGRVSRELGKGGVPDPELIKSAVGELLSEFPALGSLPTK